MQEIVLKAQSRTELGSRAARRLRDTGLLPANIYGYGEENLLVTLDAKLFNKVFHDGHRILDIHVGDKVERSLIKEVQYDPLGSYVIHVDFTRVRVDEPIEVEVPIETMGIAKGVTSGGVLSFPAQELLVKALPGDMPEKYELNVESLEAGQFIRLKDLEPPANCTLIGDPEMVIVGVMQRRDAAEAPKEEEETTQPEVIGRKKDDSEESDESGGK